MSTEEFIIKQYSQTRGSPQPVSITWLFIYGTVCVQSRPDFGKNMLV